MMRSPNDGAQRKAPQAQSLEPRSLSLHVVSLLRERATETSAGNEDQTSMLGRSSRREDQKRLVFKKEKTEKRCDLPEGSNLAL